MAQIFSIDVELDFLITPVEWRFHPHDSSGEEPGTYLFYTDVRSAARAPRGDAWKAREEFFRLKQGDNKGLLRFLNRWGLWREPVAPVQGLAGYQWILDLVPVVEIWETQERWRKAIRGPVGEWLADSQPSAFQPRAVYPHFSLQATRCATAIRHSITLDLLRGVKFKICKRKDCRAPFAIESEHERTFCSQYCGHLESLRKKRREEKKARIRERKNG